MNPELAKELEGVADPVGMVRCAKRVIKAWEECSKAVDEFGKDSLAYGERESLLDQAVLDLMGYFANAQPF